eukprot:s3708_g10.t1
MSWSTLVLDSKDGVRVLLTRLAGSPLVRKSLPNAAAICQQYFSFRRNTAESIGNFLVRETLVHEEFVEAIIRLHEQKEGVSQDQRDFGLPPASDDWDDDSWNGSWGWWNYDDEYPYEEGDDEGLPPVDSPGARGDGGPGPTSEGTPVAASPGSSPSHGHSTSGGRALTSTVGTQTNSATVVNEMSVTDSFIMGVLRGWRLLQAAGLSAEEKRDILGATKNSLDYDTIASALQNLWDDQLLAGHRHRGGGDHHFHMAEQTDYEGFYQDEWWPEEESWHDGYYVDGYGAEDEWWPDDWSGMEQQQAEAELEDNAEVSEKLKEAQKAEQVAESLAMEANRTWSEAHRAAQALRRDRGFGAVTATKGSGKCFNYGGNHFVRDCPSARFNGGYKGSKGKASAYVSDVFGDYYIGKGKGKGKSIGMDYLGAQGVGMMIDFATGLAMKTKDPQPSIIQLDVNRKGHFVLNIVEHLTRGQSCQEGQAHVVVRNQPSAPESSSHLNHGFIELATVWFDLAVGERDPHEHELAVARDRMWMLYHHARTTSSSAAATAQMCGVSCAPLNSTTTSSRIHGISLARDAGSGPRDRGDPDGIHESKGQAEATTSIFRSGEACEGGPPRSEDTCGAVAVLQQAHSGATDGQPVGPMDRAPVLQSQVALHSSEGSAGEHHGHGQPCNGEAHAIGVASAPGGDEAHVNYLPPRDEQDHGGDCAPQGSAGTGEWPDGRHGRYPSGTRDLDDDFADYELNVGHDAGTLHGEEAHGNGRDDDDGDHFPPTWTSS